MEKTLGFFYIIFLLCITCINSYAHKPIVIDGGPSSIDNPYIIKDINVSQVAYHYAKEGQLEIWLKFFGKENTKVKIQLGSPKLDDSKPVYFPAFAILSKNLPPVTVPFSVPSQYGGQLFTTQSQKPEIFHEKFTGTYSWIFEEVEYILPSTGDYYIVGYIPDPREGKFWIAVGEKEQFGLLDILGLPKTVIDVRNFHEVFPIGGMLIWLWFIIIFIMLSLLTLLGMGVLYLVGVI